MLKKRLLVLGEEFVVELVETDAVDEAVYDDGVAPYPRIERRKPREAQKLLRLVQQGDDASECLHTPQIPAELRAAGLEAAVGFLEAVSRESLLQSRTC